MKEPETEAREGRADGGGRAWLPVLVLAIVVVISGASVMIFEFLAVRFLARFFGSSLDVWGSVITVLLAALSGGYATGGVLADRFGTVRPMAWMLVLAGVTGLAMERIAVMAGERLLQVDSGLLWHPYVAAGLASFVPVFALGTVLPQAVRMRAVRTGRVGSAAGWMSGLSTLGSIAGVMLTVHVFLPRVGVRETLYVTSAVLVLTGLALGALRWKRLAVLVGVLGWLPACSGAEAEVIYEDYSAYHHIMVEDMDGQRRLLFDDALQSAMSLRDIYRGGFEYTDFFHAAMVLEPSASRVLFVGLGGGTGPKAFLAGLSVDAGGGGGNRSGGGTHCADVLRVAGRSAAAGDDSGWRVYLERSRQAYGAILMDAYASGPYGAYLPSHLVTEEFFAVARRRLTNGGCLVYNVMGTYGGNQDDQVRGVYSTLSKTFEVVYAFAARSSGNTVFVAQHIEPAKLEANGTREGRPWPAGPLVAASAGGGGLGEPCAALDGRGRPQDRAAGRACHAVLADRRHAGRGAVLHGQLCAGGYCAGPSAGGAVMVQQHGMGRAGGHG